MNIWPPHCSLAVAIVTGPLFSPFIPSFDQESEVCSLVTTASQVLSVVDTSAVDPAFSRTSANH